MSEQAIPIDDLVQAAREWVRDRMDEGGFRPMPNTLIISPRTLRTLARSLMTKRRYRRWRGRKKEQARRWRASLERCAVPGCDALTDGGICGL